MLFAEPKKDTNMTKLRLIVLLSFFVTCFLFSMSVLAEDPACCIKDKDTGQVLYLAEHMPVDRCHDIATSNVKWELTFYAPCHTISENGRIVDCGGDSVDCECVLVLVVEWP